MINWYESKTLWGAIGLIVLGGINLAQGGSFKETIEYFLIALVAVGLRTSYNQKIK